MTCLFVHKWNGCKCEKCGKTRNEQHDWDWCKGKCKRCDATRPVQHDEGYEKGEMNYTCTRCGQVNVKEVEERKREKEAYLEKVKARVGLEKFIKDCPHNNTVEESACRKKCTRCGAYADFHNYVYTGKYKEIPYGSDRAEIEIGFCSKCREEAPNFECPMGIWMAGDNSKSLWLQNKQHGN